MDRVNIKLNILKVFVLEVGFGRFLGKDYRNILFLSILLANALLTVRLRSVLDRQSRLKFQIQMCCLRIFVRAELIF